MKTLLVIWYRVCSCPAGLYVNPGKRRQVSGEWQQAIVFHYFCINEFANNAVSNSRKLLTWLRLLRVSFQSGQAIINEFSLKISGLGKLLDYITQ